MTILHSYPSLYHLGHKATAVLYKCDSVLIQEKIDGSQFNFGKFDNILKCKSKNQELDISNPPKMFASAVNFIKSKIEYLIPNATYRGEVLERPRHNVLAYARVPLGNVILFDICLTEEDYLLPITVKLEADKLGLEMVPTLYTGKLSEAPINLLDHISILGGQKIEGYVIKQYEHYGADKKCIFGKRVSESFKEVHNANRKELHPNRADIIVSLGQQYKTTARWNKAILHLKESNELTDSVQDIGKLIKEVQSDIMKECSEELGALLLAHFQKHILKLTVQGLPEWYKGQLLSQLEEEIKHEQIF